MASPGSPPGGGGAQPAPAQHHPGSPQAPLSAGSSPGAKPGLLAGGSPSTTPAPLGSSPLGPQPPLLYPPTAAPGSASPQPRPVGPPSPAMPIPSMAPPPTTPGGPAIMLDGMELAVPLPLQQVALQQVYAAQRLPPGESLGEAQRAQQAQQQQPGTPSEQGDIMGHSSGQLSGQLSAHTSGQLLSEAGADGGSLGALQGGSRQSLTDSERALSGALAGMAAACNTNKALYLGNLHPFVTEEVLQEVFAGLGGITELKVIRDKASNISAGYGFAKFADHGSAAVALAAVNKAVLFGQEMRVNWAFQKELKAEAAAHVHVFVGDLSSDITDAMLFQAFEALPGCSDARVMWDHATGRSRGYGFVSFRTREQAEAAIQAMHGHFVGSKRVRCGWAQHKTDNIVQMDPQILDRVDPTNTNVYVGNLAAHLNEANIKRHFGAYGAVSEVKLHRKGAYGFVRFETHEDAVRAIVCMNGQVLGGKQIKCSWGRHPNTPPQGVQTSLMALAAAASVGPLGPGGLAPGALSGPGAMPSPHGLTMAPMGLPMAGAAAQSIIQGQGAPVGMVPTPGLLAAEGELAAGVHAMPLDPAMFSYHGMFFGGQQIR